MSRIHRFESVAAVNEAIDLVCESCSITGNLTVTTALLRGCSFTGVTAIAATTLTCDYESFKNLIAAGISVAGVTSFVPLFAVEQEEFGAKVVTSGQFLALGAANNATSFATESDVQLSMAQSYAIVWMLGRAPATSVTATVRKGGTNQSLAVSPNSSTVSDTSPSHWVLGNQGDLISIGTSGTAGGILRVDVGIVMLG